MKDNMWMVFEKELVKCIKIIFYINLVLGIKMVCKEKVLSIIIIWLFNIKDILKIIKNKV